MRMGKIRPKATIYNISLLILTYFNPLMEMLEQMRPLKKNSFVVKVYSRNPF